MKKMLLSFVATLMLLAMPNAVFAAGNRDDSAGNTMRGNQYVNRFNNMNDANTGIDNNLRINGNMANDGFQMMNTNNNRRFNTNNNDWNNNMTTRSLNNGNVRANAADNDTDWGWLGLLGLIGLAGMMGRNRERGDIK